MRKSNNEAIIISRRINEFLNDYVPSQKTRSEHTLKAYSIALSLYIGFLETEKKIKASNFISECFSVQFIEEWLKWLMDKRGCSPETRNARLASLRAFLSYLGEREVSMIHLINAASRIKRRKMVKKKIQGMSRDAVKALMEVPDQSTRTGRRDLALFILMYGTAARIDEILSLKVENIHLEVKKPYASIIGKGAKIRTLYLLPRTVAHLKQYLREFHGQEPNPADYLFYSRNDGGKMTQPAISKRLKQYAAIAHQECSDVPTTLHAHQLRHAKASHWLEDGMNIVQISFLLGHEQVETTMRYLDITTEQELKALATLEGDNEKNTIKKWKPEAGGLAGLCGLKPIVRKNSA